MKQWLLWHLSKVWHTVRFHLALTSITVFFLKTSLASDTKFLLSSPTYFSCSSLIHLSLIYTSYTSKLRHGHSVAWQLLIFAACSCICFPKPSPPSPSSPISPCQSLSSHSLRRAIAPHFPCNYACIFHLSSGFPQAWAALISLRLQTDKPV